MVSRRYNLNILNTINNSKYNKQNNLIKYYITLFKSFKQYILRTVNRTIVHSILKQKIISLIDFLCSI